MIEHLDLLMFAFAIVILILGYPVAFSLGRFGNSFCLYWRLLQCFSNAIHEGLYRKEFLVR